MVAAITTIPRGGSRAAATLKMERFVIIVNGFQRFYSHLQKKSLMENLIFCAVDPFCEVVKNYLEPLIQ